MKKFSIVLALFAFAAVAQQMLPTRSIKNADDLIAAIPVSPTNIVDVPKGRANAAWGGVRHFRHDPTATAASNNFPTITGIGRWVPTDTDAVRQDPRWWGADATGVADSTPYIQALINNSPYKTVEFPPGARFLISQVTITNSVKLVGNQATLLPSATNPVFVVAANNCKITEFLFDGRTNFPAAISVSSNIWNTEISRNTFVNFNSKTNPIMCVPVYSLGAGTITISYNTFTNLQATPNGIIGDRAGMVRAISIESPFASGLSGEAPLFVDIVGNYIAYLDSPSAEDSDGIVVTGAPVSWQVGYGSGFIRNNIIRRPGKRAIKVSASGWKIHSNVELDDYDGATMASGWAGTSGFRSLYAFGSSYGSKNEWIGNVAYGGARECFVDIASNSVSASFNKFIGNSQKFDPSISWTNNRTEGIASYGSGATNVVIQGNDLDVVQMAIRSYAPDASWVISGNTFRHVFGTNGAQYYDPITDTWAVGGTGMLLGNSITNYNNFVALSSSNIIIAPVRSHKLIGNIFDNFSSMALSYRATNVSLENNSGINGTIEYGVQAYAPANYNGVEVQEFVTNAIASSYTYINNARFGVFGKKTNPYQWFPVEVYDSPLLVSAPNFYDETYTLAQNTNFGQLAPFTDPNRFGWRVKGWTNGTRTVVRTNISYTASNYVITGTSSNVTTTTNIVNTHWEFPETFTYKYTTGHTNTGTNWYRIAVAYNTGYGANKRYGAVVRVGPAGGASGTFEQEFRLANNYGIAGLELLRNIPVDAGGSVGFVSAARITYNTNDTLFFDIKPATSSGSRWAVQVLPDFTSPLLQPETQWHAYALTNIVETNAFTVSNTNETLQVIITNLSDHLYHFKSGTREYYTVLQTNQFATYAVGGLDTMDFRVTNLRWNGTNLGTVGTTYSFTNGVAYTNGQVQLNMAYTGGITATTNSWGQVTLAGPPASTNSGSVVSQNGAYFPIVNIKDASTIAWTSSSGSNFLAAVVAGSLSTNLLDATAYSLLMQGLGLQYAYLNSNQTFTANNTFSGALDSPGSGSGSFKAGASALASGSGSAAVGPNAAATALSGVAFGSALANDTNTTAVGSSAQALHNFSSAIGAFAVTTRTNQTMLGPTFATPAIDPEHEVTTYGRFVSSNGVRFLAGTSNKLLIATAGTDFYGAGKAIRYNGTNILMEPPSDGTVYGFSNGIPVAVGTGSGSGGLGTNFFLNNVKIQPAKLTNSSTVTWTTNSGGDVVATAITGTNLFSQSVLFANGAQVDLSYTNTAETTLLSLRSGDSAVLAANSLTNGSILKLEAYGSLVQNPADWDGGIFKWKIGGLTLSFTISDTQSYNISTTNSSWNIVAYVTVQTAGASASVVTIGNLEYSYDNLTVGDPAYHGLRARRRQSGTLDTTASNTIDLTFLNFSGQEISLNAQSVAVSFLNSRSATTLGAITVNAATAITNIADRAQITWVTTNGTAYPVLVDWNKYLDWFDDCNYSVIPSSGPVTYAANGAGATQALQASEADSAGIIRLSTGTTTTGDSRYQYGNGATAISFGSSNYTIAEARIRIPTLSSATERFYVRVGFNDSVGTATDGAYMEYTDNANSGNWIGKVLNNTTAATTNLSSGPSANTWTKLKVIVDSATTNTYFFINDVLSGSLTNALPLGVGRETGVRCPQIQANGGSTGTGVDNLDIDFVHIEQWYYTAR